MLVFFFFNDTATTEIYTLSLHDALPIFCIQKTLQEICHSDDIDDQLMFAGHAAFRFATDPFYSNGFVPTVKQLIERLLTGDRKSTRLNSSHVVISYAVFCLKKKIKKKLS